MKNRSPERIFFLVLLVLVALYFGRILFIPLFFAILISFIIYPICKWLEKKKVPRSAAIGISLFIALLPIAAIVFLLVMQLSDIGHNWTFISKKINSLNIGFQLPDLGTQTGDEKRQWLQDIFYRNSTQVYSGLKFSATMVVQLFIIPFYVALILYHRSRLVGFLEHLFPGTQPAKVKAILTETVVTYYNFVKGMIIVYLVVGTLNSIGLAIIGIPNALIYGFTASILTFIPYIGIIIGSVMPVITAWALHDSIYYPLGVIAVFTAVQFLEANLIFPLAVSYRIKVNTLATLVAIFLGGIIWGTGGMILFIPFVAILKLVADRTEELHPIGRLLGDE